jgi:cysteine desulfurase
MAIYLDNNATTQPLPDVVDAMGGVLRRRWQNPSSPSLAATLVRENIEEARESVADLIGTSAERVRFSSGGTEANAIAIFAGLVGRADRRNRILFSEVEHSSILSLIPSLEARGFVVGLIPINSDGRIEMGALRDLMDERTALVSVQWVNNETGVVQPIQELVERCREWGCLFHTDAAQAVGKLPIRLDDLKPDFLTLTGHKFHGPTGVGAVIALNPNFKNPFWAGSQETGGRPGTENVAGIIGLGVAARLRRNDLEGVIGRLTSIRDLFEAEIRSSHPEVGINGATDFRVCNTTNLQFPGIRGDALRNALDLAGLECSQSSACMTARPEPSHVLTAMGLDEDLAYGSLRFSFSQFNSENDARVAASLVVREYEILRNRMAQLVA